MVIGFTQRVRTVCESDGQEGEDFFSIYIEVAILRLAERLHQMVFRLQAGSTAIVEPADDRQNPLLDVVFASRQEPDGPIDEAFDLRSLTATIRPQQAEIRNDLRIEEEECFTIRIFPIDFTGRHETFSCNEDDSGENNYFCEINICIKDDDGRFVNIVLN